MQRYRISITMCHKYEHLGVSKKNRMHIVDRYIRYLYAYRLKNNS